MALSLDAIYQPFNDFFWKQFVADEDAPEVFRFARFPADFYDSDFALPGDPALAPVPAVADEQLSLAVDRIPRLDEDGRTVVFGSTRISELYNDEILGPSIAYVPEDDPEEDSRVATFDAAKSRARFLWEGSLTGSLLSGPGATYRPALPKPRRWWDKAAEGVWTPQSFKVEGAVSPAPEPGHPRDGLLLMKIDDAVFKSILQLHVEPHPTPAETPPLTSGHAAVLHGATTAIGGHHVFKGALLGAAVTGVGHHHMVADTPATSDTAPPAAHDPALPKFESFPFKHRLEIQDLVASTTTAQPVVVNDVTISFDYCVVDVTRSWFHSAFINNTAWRIPEQAKGKLSANDGHGLPALPVGFVAVKNLSIRAPWTPEDITNLEKSYIFGPFKFDSKVVNGTIGHEGIQIIGWMLRMMPDLPPNGASPT